VKCGIRTAIGTGLVRRMKERRPRLSRSWRRPYLHFLTGFVRNLRTRDDFDWATGADEAAADARSGAGGTEAGGGSGVVGDAGGPGPSSTDCVNAPFSLPCPGQVEVNVTTWLPAGSGAANGTVSVAEEPENVKGAAGLGHQPPSHPRLIKSREPRAR
jgi:hypothetical protein